MSPEQRLEGLVLRSSPLGESDRLLTLLSAEEGLTRLAAPGARKPKSSLAGAVPLAVLSLQVGGRSGLRRVRQLRVLRNFSALAERLETLSAAQGLAELALQLVPTDQAVEGVLDDLLLQLQVLTGLPDAIVSLYLMHMLQVTEAAAEEKLRALRDARGALLIAQRRVADADNRLTCASEGNRRILRSTLRRAGLPATAPPSWGQASSAPSRRPTSL